MKLAEKVRKEDSITCVQRTKKLDFMLGKEKNYRNRIINTRPDIILKQPGCKGKSIVSSVSDWLTGKFN